MKNTINETDAVHIFDAETMSRALRRIAHEIIERNGDLSALVLAGIPVRGVALVRRIAADIEALEKVQVATGVIDIAMHRDDVGTRTALPVVRTSQLPLPLDRRTVVIVDDVYTTGTTLNECARMLRAAGARQIAVATVARVYRAIAEIAPQGVSNQDRDAVAALEAAAG